MSRLGDIISNSNPNSGNGQSILNLDFPFGNFKLFWGQEIVPLEEMMVRSKQVQSVSNSWQVAKKLVDLAGGVGNSVAARFFLSDNPKHKKVIVEGSPAPLGLKSRRIRKVVQEYVNLVEKGVYSNRIGKRYAKSTSKNKVSQENHDVETEYRNSGINRNSGIDLGKPLELAFNPTYDQLLELANLVDEFGGISRTKKALDILSDLRNDKT